MFLRNELGILSIWILATILGEGVADVIWGAKNTKFHSHKTDSCEQLQFYFFLVCLVYELIFVRGLLRPYYTLYCVLLLYCWLLYCLLHCITAMHSSILNYNTLLYCITVLHYLLNTTVLYCTVLTITQYYLLS